MAAANETPRMSRRFSVSSFGAAAEKAQKLTRSISLTSCSTTSSISVASPTRSPESQRAASQSGTTGAPSIITRRVESPHIVIIGAGYAGSLLAKSLEDAVKSGLIRLTVIERREFMFHKIAALRSAVACEAGTDNVWLSKMHIPLSLIIKYGRVIVGNVTTVCGASKHIYFEDGELAPVHFDILVCATGMKGYSPGDLPASLHNFRQLKSHFLEVAQAIREANDIIIVGAGATAIELAGEIRNVYPHKKITLMTAGTGLLTSSVARMSTKFLNKVLDRLKDMNVDVMLKERVMEPRCSDFSDSEKFKKNILVRTSGSKELMFQCELLIWAAPSSACSEMFPEDWTNEIGELHVDSTFRLNSRKDVFAFGDVTSIPETKQAITLPRKLPIIVNNILRTASAMVYGTFDLRGGCVSGLKTYQYRESGMMYLSMGPSRGVTQLGSGIIFTDFGTRHWKGKDLFSDRMWKKLTGKPFEKHSQSVPTDSTLEPEPGSTQNTIVVI